MSNSSRQAREAEAFDAFRRDLIRRALPVGKTARAEWEARFKEFVETALPTQNKLFQKPGLAARLFAAEIELPESHPRDLEVFAQQLDLVWEAKLPAEFIGWRTLTSPDRRDLVWEFALDLGAAYVTGSVKLRNYPFERPAPRDRSERPSGQFRRDDRDRPPYQRDDRPSGGGYRGRDDRPSGGGYRGDRPQGGGGYQGNRDRPQGGGGYNRYDRPQGGGGYRGDRPQGGGFNRDSGFKPRDRKFGGRPYKKRPEGS
ncbi:MAG: hypothetical protein WD716_05455 [Fimbriimonadaceae bacterium]